jgi:hypothetical protein
MEGREAYRARARTDKGIKDLRPGDHGQFKVEQGRGERERGMTASLASTTRYLFWIKTRK